MTSSHFPRPAATVGIVHPGEMGASVGACLVRRGIPVLWASEERSQESRSRASAAELTEVASLRELSEGSDIVLSICPPGSARSVAETVVRHGFSGLFVDANAVSPATARDIRSTVESHGAGYVDGGIIGPPPTADGNPCRLYLSGSRAEEVAALFASSPVLAEVLEGEPMAASALKMTFAAWSKGSQALLLAARAAARQTGVEEHLMRVWAATGSDLSARSVRAAASADKGWRWVGEMHEIADTFAGIGLPTGFHEAAATVFARLEGFKGVTSAGWDEVASAIAPPRIGASKGT
jgi:3-hydroxyisobutyrate dehydrogenase-like beta-hydroxyacid dehydrogenase